MKQLDNIQLVEVLIEVISEVVSEYECAVIPGFGGFVSHYQSARFEPALNLIHPPSRSVSFNALLYQNDGLLAQRFAEKLKVQYKDALAVIQELVGQWNDELNEGKKVELNNWGVFAKTKEGKVQFSSSIKKNLHTASYGLKGVKAELIQKDGISGKLKEEYVNRQASPVFNQKIRRSIVAISSTAAVVLLCFWTVLNYNIVEEKAAALSLFFFGSNETTEKLSPSEESSRVTEVDLQEKGEIEAQNSFLVDQTSIDTVDRARQEISDEQETLDSKDLDTEDSETEKNSQSDGRGISITATEKIDNTAVELGQEKNEIKESNFTTGKYVIIAGCFQSIDNANNFVQGLNELGYPAHLNGFSSTGLHRVAYGTFDDRVQALKKLASIRLNHSAQAWMTRR